MSSDVTVSIDEAAVVNAVTDDMLEVFRRFGSKVRARARANMILQSTHLVYDPKHILKAKSKGSGPWREVWNNDTPKGEPPRSRTGFIKHYINAVFDGHDGVVIGPEALARHSTECLARLEFGDHPFMAPAFNSVVETVPDIWADVLD